MLIRSVDFPWKFNHSSGPSTWPDKTSAQKAMDEWVKKNGCFGCQHA
jgi:hypothetical protein